MRLVALLLILGVGYGVSADSGPVSGPEPVMERAPKRTRGSVYVRTIDGIDYYEAPFFDRNDPNCPAGPVRGE